MSTNGAARSDRTGARRFRTHGAPVARRPNYGFEKRQKEILKQKKKTEKEEQKRLKKEAEEAGQDSDIATAADLEALGLVPPSGDDEEAGAGD